MDSWLTDARSRLAGASGVDAGDLRLTEAQVTTLLDLARIAAHDSGDRTNAPLICFLVGVAMGREPGGDLDELAKHTGRTSP